MEGIRLQLAQKHLSKDQVLKTAIEAITLPARKYESDLYFGLVKSIISQQLSVKAADTIFGRFISLFEDKYPDSEVLISIEDASLRSVGLSGQKTKYVKNVAFYFREHNLFEYDWSHHSNDEIIELLTQIKGVGRWTVEMILMFVLKREDIFPVMDLGIQNGIKQLYGIEAEKKELIAKMELIAEPWSPFRSIACLYLWASKDI